MFNLKLAQKVQTYRNLFSFFFRQVINLIFVSLESESPEIRPVFELLPILFPLPATRPPFITRPKELRPSSPETIHSVRLEATTKLQTEEVKQ